MFALINMSRLHTHFNRFFSWHYSELDIERTHSADQDRWLAHSIFFLAWQLFQLSLMHVAGKYGQRQVKMLHQSDGS